jgi:trans-aconitate methyltransferase
VKKGGREQTRSLAEAFIRFIDLPDNFSGTILDFGCGTGDAIPVLKKRFPKARLIGIDFSEEAIEKCIQNYGNDGKFLCGTFETVTEADLIIASNIFEHLSGDMEIAKQLIMKCRLLCIIVPYMEEIKSEDEHINSYTENSFNELNPYKVKIFKSKGWSENGIDLIFNIYLKNIFKYIIGYPIRRVRKQILFCIK